MGVYHIIKICFSKPFLRVGWENRAYGVLGTGMAYTLR